MPIPYIPGCFRAFVPRNSKFPLHLQKLHIVRCYPSVPLESEASSWPQVAHSGNAGPLSLEATCGRPRKGNPEEVMAVRVGVSSTCLGTPLGGLGGFAAAAAAVLAVIMTFWRCQGGMSLCRSVTLSPTNSYKGGEGLSMSAPEVEEVGPRWPSTVLRL